MFRARFLGALAAAAAVAALAAGGALAATPQTILNDYRDNGRLDATYSKSDLERALKSAVVQAYGHGKTQGLKPAIKTKITKAAAKPATKATKPTSRQGVLAAPPVKPVKTQTSGLPFTGLDLGLIAFGAVALLLFGAALRRFARQRA